MFYCCARKAIYSLYEHAIWNSDRQVTYNPRVVVKVSTFRSARRRRSSMKHASTNQRYTGCSRVSAAQLRRVDVDVLPFFLSRSHLTIAFARCAQPVIWWANIYISLSSEFVLFTAYFISEEEYRYITLLLILVVSHNRLRAECSTGNLKGLYTYVTSHFGVCYVNESLHLHI